MYTIAFGIPATVPLSNIFSDSSRVVLVRVFLTHLRQFSIFYKHMMSRIDPDARVCSDTSWAVLDIFPVSVLAQGSPLVGGVSGFFWIRVATLIQFRPIVD